ncbi:MAG: hypothetical protein IKB58_01145, partial [Oscillospiraceae bacterium]|nr:hypothetical protein [Oscillospiraceae bacterium]
MLPQQRQRKEKKVKSVSTGSTASAAAGKPDSLPGRTHSVFFFFKHRRGVTIPGHFMSANRAAPRNALASPATGGASVVILHRQRRIFFFFVLP